MANLMTFDEYLDRVDERDAPVEGPHGWIQWKGTDVCIGLHCDCGHDGHFDGDFFYHYECPACGRKYAVGAVVRLIELTPEEVACVEASGRCFATDT